MPRLVKIALFAAPLPAAFALGFLVSRYLIDRDLRQAESALIRSISNYEAARAEHVARLQEHYSRIQQLIDRIEPQRSTSHVAKH
jgi:hypothetical protein